MGAAGELVWGTMRSLEVLEMVETGELLSGCTALEVMGTGGLLSVCTALEVMGTGESLSGCTVLGGLVGGDGSSSGPSIKQSEVTKW